MKQLLARLGITNKDSFKSFVVQFIKFGVVGLSNTIISLAIYYVFIYINRDWYILGNIVGWIISVANAFFWNRRFVFKNSGASIAKTLFKTYIIYGGSFLLSTVLLILQVEILGLSELIAPIVNLIITIPLNYLLNKFWAFK